MTRRLLGVAVVGWIVTLAACQYGVTAPTDPTATATTSTSTSTSTTSPSALTYTTDIQPVLASDCVSCHGPSTRAAGYDLSTYALVMRTVTPGSANSLLILVTRSGGLMYSQLHGNRSQRATTISDWIVKANAAQ